MSLSILNEFPKMSRIARARSVPALSALDDLLGSGALLHVVAEDALVGDEGEGEDGHAALVRRERLGNRAHS